MLKVLLILEASLQHVVNASPGEVIGEMGALCCQPQPFTVRSKKLSQLLRINRTDFLSIIQGNIIDGQTVMDNLYQVSFCNIFNIVNSLLLSTSLLCLQSAPKFSLFPQMAWLNCTPVVICANWELYVYIWSNLSGFLNYVCNLSNYGEFVYFFSIMCYFSDYVVPCSLFWRLTRQILEK